MFDTDCETCTDTFTYNEKKRVSDALVVDAVFLAQYVAYYTNDSDTSESVAATIR